MSRLIIISNRVSAPQSSDVGNQGGLAIALAAALRESNGIWFGWSGTETETFSGGISLQRHFGVTTATIELEAQDIDEYYNGYANRTLWPLFHYRLDLAEYERGFADGYERVNARFADTAIPLIEAGDLVWINDYHLFPLGRELRKRGCSNPIGFFLHIPWPPMRLLMSLPNHRELVEAMFDYDVIGFQSQDWLDSFLDYACGQLHAVVDSRGIVTHHGRSVRLLNCPIGIDTAEFVASLERPVAQASLRAIRDSAHGRTMIIGVDRLDYSKGLHERFSGYERFLAQNPALHGKLFLLQIAPPSRENVQSYREIRSTLEGLTGRINGEYADAQWVPVRYVNKGYPRDQLGAMFRASRIGLVTPLRDGMNLVAKEYVAAQEPEDPGVLILSQFTGAAEQLTQALLVNPLSAEDIADAIGRALAMPLAERKARWRASMDNIAAQDVSWWRRNFTEALAASKR